MARGFLSSSFVYVQIPLPPCTTPILLLPSSFTNGHSSRCTAFGLPYPGTADPLTSRICTYGPLSDTTYVNPLMAPLSHLGSCSFFFGKPVPVFILPSIWQGHASQVPLMQYLMPAGVAMSGWCSVCNYYIT